MPSEGRTWEDVGEGKLCIQVDLDIKQLVTLSKRSKKFNIITKYSFYSVCWRGVTEIGNEQRKRRRIESWEREATQIHN